MNAPTLRIAPKARAYERETFSRMAYWIDGVLSCGCCDAPIYDARCEGCQIVFHGDKPVPSYAERRAAFHDANSNALIRCDFGSGLIL